MSKATSFIRIHPWPRAARLLSLAALLCSAAAQAERIAGDEATWKVFDASVKTLAPVSFDKELRTAGSTSAYKNQAIKPEGAGPFPAVVLMPSCAGVNTAMVDHAKRFLKAGFAVLVLDPYEARRLSLPFGSCNPQTGYVATLGMALDAQAALKHLQGFEAIDRKRIFAVGWSTGGIGALWSASAHHRKEIGAEQTFTASATHYANCVYQEAPAAPRLNLVRKDIDQPVLLLLAETDMPVSNCLPLLEEVKAAGKPVSWQVMAGASHLWDRLDDRRNSRVNGFGQTIPFGYSVPVIEQASKLTIEFFDRFK